MSETLKIFDEISSYTLGEFNFWVDGLIEDGQKHGQIEIMSYGGDVFSAIAICEKMAIAQKRDGIQFHASVFGLAASAAGLIAMACDDFRMSAGGTLMIHSAHVEGEENDEDKEKPLDKGVVKANDFQNALIRKRVPEFDVYALTSDMWYSSEEALSVGLIDGIISAEGYDAAVVQAAYEKFLNGRKTKKGDIVMKVKANGKVKADENVIVEDNKAVENADGAVKDDANGEVKDDVDGEVKDNTEAESGDKDPIAVLLDAVAAIIDRLDNIEHKLDEKADGVTIEAEGEDGQKDDEQKDEEPAVVASTRALYAKIGNVGKPVQRKAATKEISASADLKHFNSIYPDLTRFYKD